MTTTTGGDVFQARHHFPPCGLAGCPGEVELEGQRLEPLPCRSSHGARERRDHPWDLVALVVAASLATLGVKRLLT